MKSLFLLFVVCQLTEAVNIAAVVIDGNTANSCSSEEKLEEAIQSLRTFARAMVSIKPQCGEGIWHQLVSINMSSANSKCPDGWVEENEGVRACGRGTVDASCESVFLNNDDHQIRYTRVCGRAIAYQHKTTDAFDHRNSDVTIDQNYVDGLSITYGSPRQHLWTFAAAWQGRCPCSSNFASPPSFVDNNWYCESGNANSGESGPVYSSDPLWDGENCEGTCCSNGKSPPWFSVEIPAPTGDYIEARTCANEHSDRSEDAFINIFEIFVQ